MRRFLEWLLGFVIGFVILKYVASFNAVQSLTLAFMFAGINSSISASTVRQPAFIPYGLFVVPNFHAILTDFELMQDTTEDWAKIDEAVGKLPNSPWNIWKSGFSISFLTPELRYRRGWSDFVTKVDLYASLAPVRSSASLHMLQGINGCRLKLRLIERDWETIKHKETFKNISAHDVSDDKLCGTVDIVIAIIPYEEFDVYKTPYAFSRKAQARYENIIKERTNARQRYGWKGKLQKNAYDIETQPDHSNEIEHRYFKVSHWAL